MSESEAIAELDSLRNSIDNIDAALVHLLAERFKCTQQVGRLKATNGMPPSQTATTVSVATHSSAPLTFQTTNRRYRSRAAPATSGT